MKKAKLSYKNRYGDTFVFEELDNGNIRWSGDFKWSRFGLANDYTEAWKVFQEQYGGLSYEEFIEDVHSYDDEKQEYIFKELLPLIKSTNEINMVDPSGGPYIATGMDMGLFGMVFKKKRVVGFKPTEEGYEIMCEKKENKIKI